MSQVVGVTVVCAWCSPEAPTALDHGICEACADVMDARADQAVADCVRTSQPHPTPAPAPPRVDSPMLAPRTFRRLPAWMKL